MNKSKIGIAGLGMVGGAVLNYFKKAGYDTIGYDKPKGVGSIKELAECQFIYVCVPTPYIEAKGCDTSIVEEIIRDVDLEIKVAGGVNILTKMNSKRVFIIKSTVIPGTTDRLQNRYPFHKFLFVPEFLTEITSDQDMNFPDRQIIGYTENSYDVATDILLQLPLAPFSRIVKAEEAEMIKYFGNTFFALKVIFANQFYDLCKKIEIDYNIVMECVSADKRIGRTHMKIMHKGYRGYGDETVSKCLPKDVKAISCFASEHDVRFDLIDTVQRINESLWIQREKDIDIGKKQEGDKGFSTTPK